jgi:DNA-binding FadR family transcriptional regulator
LYEIPENPIFLTLQTAYVSWLSVHWVKIKGGAELNRLIYSGHEAIFNAIVDRDPDEAERELNNHLRVAWERVKYTLNDS